MPSRRDLDAAFDVDLIAEKSESRTERATKFFLEFLHLLDRPSAELRCDAGETFVGVVTRQRDRHDRRADDLRLMRGEITKSFVQDRTVVYFRTENDLSVQLDIVVE